jgi:TonB family protein
VNISQKRFGSLFGAFALFSAILGTRMGVVKACATAGVVVVGLTVVVAVGKFIAAAASRSRYSFSLLVKALVTVAVILIAGASATEMFRRHQTKVAIVQELRMRVQREELRNLKSSGDPAAPPSAKSPEEHVPGPARARGLEGRRVRAPDVIPDLAEVHGSLDREIVGGVIRRHLNEVKYCYGAALTSQPNLSGRLKVQVTIAATGEVIASVLQSSTMGNVHVENCVVQTVRRWKFPAPMVGGIVTVSYPIDFTPGSASD